MPKRNIFLILSSHLLFCAAVILVFGNSCRLRPAAFPCLYKEYLSGVIVLAAYYAVLFLYFSVCFRRNSPALFAVLMFLTVLLASTGEMILVYPQISHMLFLQLGPDTARRYILNSCLFVLARDSGFAMFAFMSGLIQYQSWRLWQKDRTLFTHHRQVEVDKDVNSSDLVDVSDICYCEQNSNYTRIYTKDGKHHDRRCTMDLISDILSETDIVRISRKHLVRHDAIASYNKTSVNIRSGKDTPPVNIKIPRRRADEVIQRIQSYEAAKKIEKFEATVESSNPDGQHDKPVLNKQKVKIYKYVSQHPNCTVKEIRKQVKLSPNLLYRYISVLKQQGLIRHVGSNKTGGYVAVEGEMG